MTATMAGRDRAWVEVDLEALVANAADVASRAGVPLLPMVKANGYGLGAVPVARALGRARPWGYGVAAPSEGAELRAAGIDAPVVVFTPFWAGWRDAFERDDLRPAIGDLDALRAWLPTGRPFHVELDTGMGRAGFRVGDAALLAELGSLLAGSGCEGLFTHYHSADSDAASVERQWAALHAAVAALGARPRFVHAANSAGAMRPAGRCGDLARPGVYLYGGTEGGMTPRPVASLQARVVAVRRVGAGETVSYGATWTAGRETTIATLAAGYADGVPRALSNRGQAMLAGRALPIAGRVTMDMTLLDAGDLPVRPGDVAAIWGGPIGLEAQARAAGTISYELLTSIGGRVPRLYAGA